jgi:hypothetical protein
MPYECKTSCQVEVTPGVFKHIQAGQTHFDAEKKRPINYVKPIARKYFRLTGDSIKKDLIDKKNIKKALDERKIRYPVAATTSHLAKLLAEDNKRRGIVNLESLVVAVAPTHFADQKIIDAKARIDELFGLSDYDNRPYTDDTPLDTLTKMIVDKEAELSGESEEGATERDEILAYLKAHDVKPHHNTGIDKLRAMKEELDAKLATGSVQNDPEGNEK